jgi:hypothetical protein
MEAMIRKHKCPIFLSTVVMWWLKCVLVFQLCHMSFGLRGWWNSDSAIMQAFLPFRVHKQLVENKQGIFFLCVWTWCSYLPLSFFFFLVLLQTSFWWLKFLPYQPNSTWLSQHGSTVFVFAFVFTSLHRT